MSTPQLTHTADGVRSGNLALIPAGIDRSVSRIILDTYQIEIRPSRKGQCPFCGHSTFAVKSDDSIAKCFHPKCLRYVSPAQYDREYKSGIAAVHDQLFEECHQALLRQKETGGDAWEYLTNDRSIHPSVIEAAPIGVIPKAFDQTAKELFGPLIQGAQAAVESEKGRPGRKPQKETLARLD